MYRPQFPTAAQRHAVQPPGSLLQRSGPPVYRPNNALPPKPGTSPLPLGAVQRRSAPPVYRGVVQRAIGFEYEIGDMTVSRENSNEPLTKGDVIWRDDGFNVTVDDLKGKFDLEIIVKEIDDRLLGSRSQAAKVLGSIKNLLETMEKKVKEKNGKKFPATEINSKADPTIYFKAWQLLAGKLQATAGLSLSALHAIRSGKIWDEINQEDGESKRSSDRQFMYGEIAPGSNIDLLKVVNSKMGALASNLGLTGSNLNHLKTIISLILEMPINARMAKDVDYPKALAGPLMARTDFATIMGLLPQDQQDAIARNLDQWVDGLVQMIAAATEQKVSPDDPVIPKGALVEKAPSYDLTLKKWFRNIGKAKGSRVDKLTAENYGGNKDQKEWLESLGGFGGKMDPGGNSGIGFDGRVALVNLALISTAYLAQNYIPEVNLNVLSTVGAFNSISRTEERNRPIFEFRTLSDNLPYELLQQAGLELWDLVDRAHGRSQSTFSVSTVERAWNWTASWL